LLLRALRKQRPVFFRPEYSKGMDGNVVSVDTVAGGAINKNRGCIMKRLIAFTLAVVLTGCGQSDQTDTARHDPAITTDDANTAAQVPVPAPVARGDGPKAQVFQFGIYKAAQKGQIVDSSVTDTGKVVRKPVLEHVSMTNQIPLVKGTYFGFQYRLWNLPPEVMIKPVMDLRKVLIHPEMTLPDGSKTTGWDQTFKGKVKTQQVLGFDGYAFNEDYELVEGNWIFQVWYKDKKLIERKFVSYHPGGNNAASAAAE